MQKYFKEVCEEIKGITDTIGVDYYKFSSWLLAMGCCMYNMYNVIKGSYRQFQHLKGCYSWDILPGMNLAVEHDCEVVIEGKPYEGEFLMPGVKYRFSVSHR